MTQFRRTVTTLTSTDIRIDGIILEKGLDDEAVSTVTWFSVEDSGSTELTEVNSKFSYILEALYQRDEKERELERQRALEAIDKANVED